MKLAIYIRTIKSAQGTERVTSNIARGLADRGHQVDFLLENDDGWLVQQLDSHPNINVINLCNKRGPVLVDRAFQLWILLSNILARPLSIFGIGDTRIARLARLMVHDNPPVLSLYRYAIHNRPATIMSFLNQQNIVLLLLSPMLKGKARIVVNVRNHISTSAQHGKSKWMRSVPRLMRRFFPRADLIISPSQGVADDAQAITGINPERFRVIYNPVYRRELIDLSQEPVRHQWFMESDIPVIIAAGKLKPQKNFDTLLQAFSAVHKQRAARLMILGRGREHDKLVLLAKELGIQNDFQMPGHVTNPYAYFRCASVFVLSSAWEGLPNVLIEALACGCPPVSTDCPSGPYEILDGGKIGKLVPVGDADAMASAILELLDSPPPPDILIKRAKAFSYDQAITGYEEILCGSEA